MRTIIILLLFPILANAQIDFSFSTGADVSTYKFKDPSSPYINASFNLHIHSKSIKSIIGVGYSNIFDQNYICQTILIGTGNKYINLYGGIKTFTLDDNAQVHGCINTELQITPRFSTNIYYSYILTEKDYHLFGANVTYKFIYNK